jgi:hypothetical protein
MLIENIYELGVHISMTIEENANLILQTLANLPRKKVDFPNLTGDELSKLTRLNPDNINDAVSILVQSGFAQWLQTLGSAPYNFSDVGITPRGRNEYENSIKRIAQNNIATRKMSIHEIDLLVEGYIGTTTDGYLNNFSYSKHERFYPLYCNLDIDVPAYRAKGHTTRTAFIQILKDAQPRDQAKIIRGVFEMVPPPGEANDKTTQKKRELYKELLAVADRLEADGQVTNPIIQQTSETVYEALKDAEALLKTRGAKNAVDRAHTALHGYLKRLCLDRGETLQDDSQLTFIYKILREKFPEFSTTIPHGDEVKKVFRSIAVALDSLNTIRNHATLSHPNEMLLDEPEAMLYINLSRTVLAYIEAKVRKK